MKALHAASIAILYLCVTQVYADNQWISTTSSAWTNAANWTNTTYPAVGDNIYFLDSASIQHAVGISNGVNAEVQSINFGLFSGGAGFVIAGVGGWNLNIHQGGIVNNDDNTQVINAPVVFYRSNSTFTGGAQTWIAAAGNLLFPGTNLGTSVTVQNNGGSLTIDGAFNTTIGVAPGRGDLSGAGPLIKNGAGTLTLGGTIANSYRGTNVLNAGIILAAKPNALNTNGVYFNGGTFRPGGFGQTNMGKLVMQANSTIDLTQGATNYLSFTNSSAVVWSNGVTVNIVGWPGATNFLRVGTSAAGLTAKQLNAIAYPDIPGATAAISSTGYVTPVVPTVSLVLSITNSSGNFTLSFQTQTNYTYFVEFETALYPTNWMPLQSLPGTGGTVSVTDTNPPDAARFYRVRAQ